MADRADRRRRIFALGAATAGAVTDVGYLRLIAEQDTGSSARVSFVATFIAGMTLLALFGALSVDRQPRAAEVALLAAAMGFAAIGFISLFSIGFVLILAAVFAGLAIPFVDLPGRWVAASLVGPIAALAVGLIST